MRVVVPPVLLDDRIYRIVAPIEALLEVEEWVGSWWQPSTMPLTTASGAPPAEIAVLLARGVPVGDWAGDEPRSAPRNIEALLQTNDPDRASASALDDSVKRSPVPRRNQYPGNARFGLQAHDDDATERLADRRRARGAVPKDGRRRRSALPPPDSAD
jgi:hypothetical protein